MVRVNKKNISVNEDNIVKKSNELSLAEMNKGLSLVQMQLFAYAIYTTQKNGVTTFHKSDFEKQFNLSKLNTIDAYRDSDVIMDLKLSSTNLNKKEFSKKNVFMEMNYKNGLFSFKWNPDLVDDILDLKEKYIVTDLSIAMQFKSYYSWRLYEHLKARFGHWFIKVTKDELLSLFGVSDKKSYVTNTAKFRHGVLDVAINEINEHSELEVWYDVVKEGRKITGFKINWSVGKRKDLATENQLILIREMYNEVTKNASEYITTSDSEQILEVHQKITAIKKINDETNERTTKEEADNYIKRMKSHLNYLNDILK